MERGGNRFEEQALRTRRRLLRMRRRLACPFSARLSPRCAACLPVDVPLEGHVHRFCLLRNGFGLLLGPVELEDRLGSDLDDAVLHAVLLVLTAS